MAIEIKLQKANNESWGFSLTGGVDYKLPIIVSRVIERGIAEQAGLQQDDIIVRINDTPTAGLTHSETHETLQNSAGELTLVVRRDSLEEIILSAINDEENNNEIKEILRKALESEKCLQNKKHCFTNLEAATQVPENQKSESKCNTMTIVTKDSDRENIKINKDYERKWSTFLQKPNKPVPIPELERKKESDYKVIIKKQKKKSRFAKPDEEKVILHESATEVEETQAEDVLEKGEIEPGESTLEIELNYKVLDETEITEYEGDGEEEEISENISKASGPSLESTLNITFDNEPTECTETGNVPTLEQQLAAVQKQLQELSQLPSAIQDTLNEVTKQLAHIVGAKVEEKSEMSKTDKDVTDIEQTEDEHTDQILNEDTDDLTFTDKTDTGEIEHNENATGDEKEMTEDESAEHEETVVTTDIDGLTEEERELIILEDERISKLQKEMILGDLTSPSKLPPKPNLRPIILPGGRKWSAPDDACPAPNNPKMSDDKICNTIETYSEVIIGKTKGESNCHWVKSRTVSQGLINFLKYQPPPKNLDYLQRSDVYRMVHEMEPPVKGISLRPGIVLAAEDYLQDSTSQ